MSKVNPKPVISRTGSSHSYTVYLLLFDWLIVIRLDSESLARKVALIYQPFITHRRFGANKLSYRISLLNRPSGLVRISRAGGDFNLVSLDFADFFYLLEKDLTIELQRKRKDLYFVHSAVLAYKDTALMIVAPSGTGKSTTTWGLLNRGFQYLSDELAPIDLKNFTVWGYPRALCLKASPPVYPLPHTTLRIGTTFHVPTSNLPTSSAVKALPLKTIFFLEYDPACVETNASKLSTTESAMHVYANTLNALAHSGKGLDAAIEIGSKVACYRLKSARDLNGLINTVTEVIKNLSSQV